MKLTRVLAVGVLAALGVLADSTRADAQNVTIFQPLVYRRPIPVLVPPVAPINTQLNPRLPATLYMTINFSYLGGGGQFGNSGQFGGSGQAGGTGQFGSGNMSGQGQIR